MGKQNIALFERALKMLSPYARELGGSAGAADAPPGQEPAGQADDPRLRRLEAQIEALRLQLEALGRKEG
jgi:hypothetical protein